MEKISAASMFCFVFCLFAAGCGGKSSTPSPVSSSQAAFSSNPSSLATGTSSTISSSASTTSSEDASSTSFSSEQTSSHSSSYVTAGQVDTLLTISDIYTTRGVSTSSNKYAFGIEELNHIEWLFQIPETNFFRLEIEAATTNKGEIFVYVDEASVTKLSLAGGTNLDETRVLHSVSFILDSGVRSIKLQITKTDLAVHSIKLIKVTEHIDDPLHIGLWRLASRNNRLTVTPQTDPHSVDLENFSGHHAQAWRISSLGENSYQFKLPESSLCLSQSASDVGLGNCNNSQATWKLKQIRLRSEDQPAIYWLQTQNNLCLLSSDFPKFGECNSDAGWYLEPIGFGERQFETEHTIKAALIIKKNTIFPSSSQAKISDVVMAEAIHAFTKTTAEWMKLMTDGRIAWEANTYQSPDPLTSFTVTEGKYYLPAAENVSEDLGVIARRCRSEQLVKSY